MEKWEESYSLSYKRRILSLNTVFDLWFLSIIKSKLPELSLLSLLEIPSHWEVVKRFLKKFLPKKLNYFKLSPLDSIGFGPYLKSLKNVNNSQIVHVHLDNIRFKDFELAETFRIFQGVTSIKFTGCLFDLQEPLTLEGIKDPKLEEILIPKPGPAEQDGDNEISDLEKVSNLVMGIWVFTELETIELTYFDVSDEDIQDQLESVGLDLIEIL